MLNKININNPALYPILLLSFIFFTFSITDILKGNGYLAVYIAGILVGNSKITHRKNIYTVMDGLAWLCQIVMFLCLGLLVNPHEMLEVAAVALLIGIFMILIGRPLSVFLCLLPFKKINMKSRVFISWIGLRGAVPIIFATYPVVAEVEGSNVIFNIVFFITILSLIIQGTTVSTAARLLRLSTPLVKTGNEFGVELPEEIDTKELLDMTVTEAMLEQADTLKDMELPQGTLVMIVKRGNEFLIPNGTLLLHAGDQLLLISEKDQEKAKIPD
ncbi:Na(+)/H(+) antiporter [Bacteroides reticulotermitis JCM 10512]|uniref:Na(+)/H(+) antiporter n=3 Tax=Bacteroides reticulotermitis TaxID=1133319 RepID=W4UR04_9BACE|nr:Na(+)/H(+) antiporter [Bacteroides reticulotermitis JCM 10512]